MNHKNITLFLFTLLATTNAWAKDHFYLIGGGGEPQRDYTIFDTALNKLDYYLKGNNKWHKGIYFNGGHDKTEKIIADISNDEPANKFRPEDYDEFIKRTLNKIQNDEIKKGEQLMLFIDSHGAIRARNGSEVSHSISSSKSSTLVNLDKLKDILELAHKKGIKVGLIDGSCHAGASIDLQKYNPSMCIITGSSDRNFSYTDFAENIANNFKSGKSLEEVFQYARNASHAKAFPMINSPVGMAVQEMLKDIQPLFFDPTYDPIGSSNNKLEAFLDSSIQSIGACQEMPIPHNLITAIDKAESLSLIQKKFVFFTVTEKKEFKELKEMIKEHYKLFNQAKKIREKTLPLLDQKVKLDPPSSHMEYSLAELSRINYNKLIAESEEIINSDQSTEDKKNRSRSLLRFYQSIKSTHERLKQQSSFQELENQQRTLDSIYQEIGKSGSNMALKERELYESLYKSLEKTELGKAPNPCQDFKL